MADEAEKLINISLCKMAESRTVRRGGASLHKHLLISTVLTKARSAYFETWYMGEGESTNIMEDDGSNGRPINLNASYQEVDFPVDDDEDDDDDDLLEDPLGDLSNNSSTSHQEEGHHHNDDDSMICNPKNNNNNNNMIDPRFFVEVESEIELPSDILSCVEKLGDLSEHMSFSVDESATPTSSGNNVVGDRITSSSEMILSDSGIEITPVKSSCNYEDASRDTQLTYLDLDSKSTQELSFTETNNNNKNNENSNNATSDESTVFGSPLRASTPNASKRRRGWSLEEDDEDEGHGTLGTSDESIVSSNPRFSDELNEKLKRNGLSIINVAKRLRFSPECEDDSGMQKQQQSLENCEQQKVLKSAKPLPVITDSKFRVKKSHFEEDDPEESDDDPFLGDSLGQSPLDNDNEQIQSPSRRNDQRVPSSGSSSDEDCEVDNSMEVDQITNLVQFISFNKQQHHSPCPTTSSSASGGPTMSTAAGLVRSMSSPDLCGLAAASSSRVSSNSANNAKDLFSSYVNNNNNSHISHRILTLTV